MKKITLTIAMTLMASVSFAGQDSGVGPKGLTMELELNSLEMKDLLQGAFSGEALNIQKPGLDKLKLRARTFNFQSKTVELISEDESIKVMATESAAQ